MAGGWWRMLHRNDFRFFGSWLIGLNYARRFVWDSLRNYSTVALKVCGGSDVFFIEYRKIDAMMIGCIADPIHVAVLEQLLSDRILIPFVEWLFLKRFKSKDLRNSPKNLEQSSFVYHKKNLKDVYVSKKNSKQWLRMPREISLIGKYFGEIPKKLSEYHAILILMKSQRILRES